MPSLASQFHEHRHYLRKLHKSLALLSVASGLILWTSCTQSAAKKSPVTATAVKKVSSPTQQSPTARTIKEVRTTPEQMVGIVRMIGAHGSFVLIETPSASISSAVPVGHLLHCHPAGTTTGSSTADLRVSPERRQPFVIADVLAGAPSVGDVAYLAK